MVIERTARIIRPVAKIARGTCEINRVSTNSIITGIPAKIPQIKNEKETNEKNISGL